MILSNAVSSASEVKCNADVALGSLLLILASDRIILTESNFS
jgi:hypothetical protein